MSVSGISDRSLLQKALIRRAIALLLTTCLGLLLTCMGPMTPAVLADVASVYQQRDRHNSDGIGKIYMGREIAQVMGHQGAAWLERSSRSWQEQPQRVVEALDLQPSDVVADIGAGTGYFSFRLSPLVPDGKVLAVDVQPEMIDILNFLKQENQATNVEPVLGTVQDPHLPAASVDLALMVDAYHEFEYPQEMMTALVRSLKPGGRVVLVEYRGENPLILIKGLHKMTQRQVKKEMQAVGLVWQETKNLLPQQHLMIFRKVA
uniref:class I SAM-dependent methyltransferase n=1 Tax=Trichocoleus desertorum TaxID=1481672 RepID=UPI0025B441E0